MGVSIFARFQVKWGKYVLPCSPKTIKMAKRFPRVRSTATQHARSLPSHYNIYIYLLTTEHG